MRARIRGLMWAMVFGAAVWTGPRAADACAPAPPVDHSVSILSEDAVIVWDAANKLEHFIRRADFQTDAAGFGFIVPTPTEPELAEAKAVIFDRLAGLVRPRHVVQTEHRGFELTSTLSYFLLGARDASPGAGAGPVVVLQHVAVAGYDAVVVEASDPAALSRWLAANGYAERDSLTEWATPYVEQRWKFTAFKLAKEEGATGMATAPVRMTFSTDTPVYPYREPADLRDSDGSEPRALRVFFIGEHRYAGELADGTAWPAQTKYAAALPWASIGDLLPDGFEVRELYLTAFVDQSSPRPGTADLLFSEHDGPEVHPDPVISIQTQPIPIPIEFPLVLGGIGFWWWRRRARR